MADARSSVIRGKPIFVATHPRACSTAFERVFMTCRDTLTCVHEPFGDAFYFGPERLSPRFAHDEPARQASGFSETTYQAVLDHLESKQQEGKRLFIKDIIHYLCPPEGADAEIAESVKRLKRGVGTKVTTNGAAPDTNGQAGPSPTSLNGNHSIAASNGDSHGQVVNPTVLPPEILSQFHFVFLIRHPRSSIPSYYRCTIPPLDKMTGFQNFMPSEAGYDELRRVFDYLRAVGQVGPAVASSSNAQKGTAKAPEICVIDADDLLDHPSGIIEAFCRSVGMPYDANMLKWDSPDDQVFAQQAFEKWSGFHEDALDSSELRPRQHKKLVRSMEEDHADWTRKYGAEAADVIRDTVNRNEADYEHLKQFALKV